MSWGTQFGLGHYVGPDVMNPVDPGYSVYQSGDMPGLTTLYRLTTCR